MNTNKRSVLTRKYFNIILISAISIIVITSLFIFILDNNKKNYLAQVTEKYNITYLSTTKQIKELTDIFFSGILENTDLIEDLKNYQNLSQKQKDTFAEQMTQFIFKRDHVFENKKLININIVNQDDTIIFSHAQPEIQNTKICKESLILPAVKKEQKLMSSFEVCNYYAGYRFAYPIIENNNYLGIVEFIYDPSIFTKTMMEEYEVLSNFFTRKTIFDNALLSQSDIYVPSHHDGFMYNKNVLNELRRVTNKTLNQRKPSEETLKKLRKTFDKKTSHTVYASTLNVFYTIIHISNTISNESQAVLIVRSSAKDFTNLIYSFYIMYGLSIILIILATIIFIYENIKNRQEKLLKEQSKLAQLGELLENIAHQWRQPLSIITASASGIKLQREYGDKDEAALNKGLDDIVNAAEHLSDTIDDFRNFYKKETKPKQFNLKKTVDKSINILSSKLHNRSIIVIKKINSTTIVGFENELIQVFMNLFKNAIDELENIDDKGRLIQIQIEKSNNKVLISFQDSAGGIQEDIIDKVFDDHFTTKEGDKGTGIGLFMSKKIIEEHLKGTIGVQNKNFEFEGIKYFGACFKIEIPLT